MPLVARHWRHRALLSVTLSSALLVSAPQVLLAQSCPAADAVFGPLAGNGGLHTDYDARRDRTVRHGLAYRHDPFAGQPARFTYQAEHRGPSLPGAPVVRLVAEIDQVLAVTVASQRRDGGPAVRRVTRFDAVATLEIAVADGPTLLLRRVAYVAEDHEATALMPASLLERLVFEVSPADLAVLAQASSARVRFERLAMRWGPKAFRGPQAFARLGLCAGVLSPSVLARPTATAWVR